MKHTTAREALGLLSTLTIFILIYRSSTVYAWTSTAPGAGAVHYECAWAALSNPLSAAFVSYLGLSSGEIANYAKATEPFAASLGDTTGHTTFWQMLNPEPDGRRYYINNGLHYIGNAHNTHGMYPGCSNSPRTDRSVDVIGAVLHSAGDSAVIVNHSPAYRWCHGDCVGCCVWLFGCRVTEEDTFEVAGDCRAGQGWTSPDLPFRDGSWNPEYLPSCCAADNQCSPGYSGQCENWMCKDASGNPYPPVVNEAHRLYWEAYASYCYWRKGLDSLERCNTGDTELQISTERPIQAAKRFATAALLDFLSTMVLQPFSAAISCHQLSGSSLTVNAGSNLSFHYSVDGDRQYTTFSVNSQPVSLGPSRPCDLFAAVDTGLYAFTTPGSAAAIISGGHNFFNLDAHGEARIDINVVPRPSALVFVDADDDDGNGIPDYYPGAESAPTILEQSTGTIDHRLVEVRDSDGSLVRSYENQTVIPWDIAQVGLYTITTTVSNGYYGPNTSSASIQLEVVLNGQPCYCLDSDCISGS